MNGNMEIPLETELENLYILIGETNGKVEQSIYDRVYTIEDIINPPIKIEPITNFECDCGMDYCWECAYRDDPMGI